MLFSVIIPVYNVAPYLRECLDSVLAAARTLNEKCKVKNEKWGEEGDNEKCKVKNEKWGVNSEKCGVEIICIDDGSTDGSGKLLDDFNSQLSTPNPQPSTSSVLPSASPCLCDKAPPPDARTPILTQRHRETQRSTEVFSSMVLHQKNAGVSVARNVGMAVATGDYICFVDADDKVEPNWLVNYAAALRDKPYDLVRIRRPWWKDTPGEIAADRVARWMWETMLPEGFPWTYCVRREVALKAAFPPGVAMTEDSIYLARLAPFVTSACQLDTDGYEHVVHDDSAMFRKIASAERVAYLTAWREIANEKCKMKNEQWRVGVISHFVTDGIMTWLARPKDTAQRGEIRRLWRELRALGCADARGIRPLYRGAFETYEWFGVLWPYRLWASFVAWVAARNIMSTMKHVFVTI